MIQFLLLLSLAFNIAHATIIVFEDKCVHESVTEYIGEQTEAQECGDLCDMHHLFHFSAILIQTPILLETPSENEHPQLNLSAYYPPFKETTTKPPIV